MKKIKRLIDRFLDIVGTLLLVSLAYIQELWGSLINYLFLLLCAFQFKLANICQIHRFVNICQNHECPDKLSGNDPPYNCLTEGQLHIEVPWMLALFVGPTPSWHRGFGRLPGGMKEGKKIDKNRKSFFIKPHP